MLVNDFLQHSAERFPDKEALICDGRRFTYAEIDQLANQMALALLASGIQRGDRVVVYLPNCMEAVIAIFGILKAGGVFVVINRTTKAHKVAFILNDCQASAIITDEFAGEELVTYLKASASQCSIFLTNPPSEIPGEVRFQFLRDILASYPAALPPNRCIDMDLAALIYTSGSTANPKGVMLTHLNIVSAATSITQYLENQSSDIILNVLPLSFDYGLYQVLMAFKIGGTLVLEKSFSYPFAIIEKIIQERVTGFPIVPTMAAILVQLDGLANYHFEHLRYISNTAAHLPQAHIMKLRQIFPGTKIYCMYGLTECKRVSYLPPEMLDIKPNSVGKGMPNEEVYIVDENGQRVGPGVVGELVVRGSNVMKGYWGLPDETRRVLKPGLYPWEQVLYTGDLFKMDEDGFLYFVARKDDIIKSRGEKVSPKEIESVIYGLPGVAEVAVIGVPDAILGQAIKAIIVPN
ncbi:MAG: AMP-binding protein, partial [candidate division KSB1 bacterium]|nr:AMP-binding protein [candidate division KSB1 bacterium]